ncbi:hypothetical protein G6F40_013907 [Rhizopus arrhizus]|nr:hypothetical protein G6F40_013907 [Rhizopus arrhizus]
MPGAYNLTLHVNQQRLSDTLIHFLAPPDDPRGSLACLAPEHVAELGLRQGTIDKLAWWNDGACLDTGSIPGMQVNTTGMTLMPSLADCHVHLVYTGGADPNAQLSKQGPAQITLTALENAQASLRGGVTALRDCGGKDYLEFGVRDAIARGVFPGPTIKASGRIICMTGGHGNRIGRIADGCEDVIKAVREQVHAGCDLVKIMAPGGVMTPGVRPMDAHYSFDEMKAGAPRAS